MAVIETETLTISSNGTIPSMPFLALKDNILGKKYSLSIAFVTPKKAQTINIQTRGKDYIPNTLSFELSKNTGEIILCASEMKKQYKDFDMDYDTYVLYIIIHSMLHLKGMAHGSTMEKAEKRLLAFFTTPTNEKTKLQRRH